MNKDIQSRNNITIKGTGEKTILLAPGFGCDQTVWKAVTALIENDFRVISFDYVGMGKTDIATFDPNKYSKLSGYVQDLLDVCSTLHLKDAVFIGHSVSGMIGLLASIQQPAYFSNLIMIGPSPCYLNEPPEYYGGFEEEDLTGLIDMMEKNYIGWANVFASTVASDSDRPDVTKDLNDRFCSTDPVIARKFAEACFFADNRQDLPKVTVPSYIMQCSNDMIAPAEVGEYIHKHIPNSKMTYMNAIGHCPHMSDPEETVHLIRTYLNEAIHEDFSKGLVDDE